LAEHWESQHHPALSTYHNALSSISLFLLIDLLGAKSPRIPSYFKTTHWAYKKMASIESRLRDKGLFHSSPFWEINAKLAATGETAGKREAKRDGLDESENDPDFVDEPQVPFTEEEMAYLAKRGGGSEEHGSSVANDLEPMFLVDHSAPTDSRRAYMIEDDHVPFMARGVDVLHIIPSPFPTVWHEYEDDGEHLDMPTTEDWAVLVTAFVGEWMDVEGFMPTAKTGGKERSKGKGEKKKRGGLTEEQEKMEARYSWDAVSKTEL
jgi:glutaminyl-peptide cyclotransferase